MKKTEVVLKQDEQKPVPVEVLAESIQAIADGVRKLRAGRLNDRAIVLLITNAAPGHGSPYRTKKYVSAWQVKAVLDGMEQLEREYLKPRKK